MNPQTNHEPARSTRRVWKVWVSIGIGAAVLAGCVLELAAWSLSSAAGADDAVYVLASPVERAAAGDSTEAVRLLSEHKASGRSGWGQATRGVAAALHRAGRHDDALDLLRGLVAEPETDFDKLDGLRQLALYLSLRSVGDAGTAAAEAQRAYEAFREHVRSKPALGVSLGFVASGAALDEADLAMQRGERKQAALLYSQVIAMSPDVAVPWHRALAMNMLSILREQEGDLKEALRLFDDWARTTKTLDTPERQLGAELRRLRLADPRNRQPETLRRLLELWTDARFAELTQVVRIAQPLTQALFTQDQPHAGFDVALETLRRVDRFRERFGIAAGPVRVADGSRIDDAHFIARDLENAERDALGRLQQGVNHGRPDLARMACLRWDVYLVNDPDLRARNTAWAERLRQEIVGASR